MTLYSVGGVVTGLVGGGLTLEDNGTDGLAIDGGGPFTFATLLPADAGYDVMVSSQPSSPPQACAVTNGQGIVRSSDVTDVEVNCCVPPPNGLVSWWRFEPPSPEADQMGLNALSYAPGATVSGGIVGDALASPNGQVVTLTSIGLPSGASDRTIELWAKLSALSRDHEPAAFLADYGLQDGGAFFSLGAPPASFFGIGVNDGGLFFTEGNVTVQGPPVTFGVWHHVAVTASDGGVSLFLDGQMVASAPVALDTAPGTPLQIACRGMGELGGVLPVDDCVDGDLDEVSVYDRALSPQEIDAIYQAGSQGKCVMGACPLGTAYADGGCVCAESAPALQSDPVNCGACGNACHTGLCDGGACATFAGAYQWKEQGSGLLCGAAFFGTCIAPNPVTGACTCPGDLAPDAPREPLYAAFQGRAASPPTTCEGTYLSLCTLGQPADLLGIYETEISANGKAACPFSAGDVSGCSCAAGTHLRLPVEDPPATSAAIVLCLGSTLPDPSFGGAYELDSSDAGASCRVANPATAGCSCPAGMADFAFPVLVDDADAGTIDSAIHLCGLQ